MPKVIVVTGTSRGIGKAIVENLFKLEQNLIVYGIARTEQPLKELSVRHQGKFYYFVGDISDEAFQSKLLSDIINRHSRIDGLVANAGVLEPVAPIGEYDSTKWKKHFDVNFFSIVSLVSLMLPYLEKTRGNIVFVSSGASTKPYFGWSCYCASKAAVNSFAQCLASELPLINTISVAPGVVDTQMQVDIRDTFGPRSMTQESLKRFTDLKQNNQLVDPRVPAAVYSKLVLNGIPGELNGKYLRYNDERL